MRDSLIRNNQQINWYPEHIKDGRFGGFLDGIIDWALSRERYWGTPLPIWECADCGKRHCIGSLSELQEMAVTPVADDLDLHRPFVDDVLLNCPQCGGEMKRVPEVIDAWFDSGSMPVAQWHYPFENHDLFAEQFPADYICEAIDQTRGWFLSLHVISTMLFDQISYRNCVCLEHVLDGKGEKMSKHKGNVVAPNTVLDVQGADALRWYMLTSSPPGTPRRFSAELVDEALRKFMLTLWNTYSFFVTYANIDNWQPAANGNALEPVRQDLSEMDRWILSELQVLITEVTEMLDHYDATGAGRAIEEFVDRLSNWYVRRSRRRFWKSESDRDKAAAYATLYECLVKLAQLLAPFTPFLTESMWQNLVCSPRPEAPDSVHLSDFPTPDATLIDQPLLEAMRLAARLVSMGRAARNKASIKVKQPLSEVIFRLDETRRENIRPLLPVILDELNVKAVRFTDDPAELVSYSLKGKLGALGPKLGRDMQAVLKALDAVDPQLVMKAKRSGQPIEIAGFQIDAADIEIVRTELPELSVVDEGDLLVGICTTLTEEQLDEGLARELVRAVQATRKAAGYQITDRIRIYLGEDETLGRVVERFSEYIRQETLADELQLASAPAAAHKSSAKLSGGTVQIAVERVAT